ncbi:MAG: hypothetical protein ACLQBL_03735 [Polyangiaceae bacterium]
MTIDTQATTTLVYQYGLAAPHEGADEVREQMRLAHRFRNALVEIERERRRETREAEAAHAPDVLRTARAMREAEAVVEGLLVRAKSERQKTGARRVVGELATAIADARAAKKAAKLAWWAARRAAADSPALIVETEDIRARASERQKEAAVASGVAWGTKALVVEAATKSFAETSMYDEDGEPQDPRFVRAADAQEAVGVQCIGGLPAVDATGGEDTQIRILQPDARAWDREAVPGRHDRRRLARLGELRLRVGSDSKRRPVWAAWRLHQDCPLPEGATIKAAAVHRRRVGPHGRWSLVLTLAVPGATYARHAARHAPQGGAVAVDLGWRALEDGGARAGVWLGDDGRGDAIEVDAATLRLLRLPQVIASERSLALERMRFGLVWWLTWGPVPEWLIERCSHAAAWRSPARFAALFRDWQRHEGDGPIWGQLESFVAHDRHAWAQEESLRQRAQARRRERYAIIASRLAQEYDTLILERFDLRAVVKSEATERGEREDHQAEGASSIRQLVAPSSLRKALVAAFRSRGKRVEGLPAGDTTRIHAECGAVEDRLVARSIWVTCEACGERFDQDRNACRVLLSRHRDLCERRSAAPDPGVARKDEKPCESEGSVMSRWARAKQKRAEREVKVAAAREALAMSAE